MLLNQYSKGCRYIFYRTENLTLLLVAPKLSGFTILRKLTKQDSSSPAPPAQRKLSPRTESNPADPDFTKSEQMSASMMGKSALRKMPSVESSGKFQLFISCTAE